MLQPKKNRRSSEMDALLEEYEGRAPAPRAGFQPGEHVHGRVVSVGDRVVTIDLDAKTPGVIDRAAFGVSNGQIVSVKVDTGKGRAVVFADTVIRVSDKFALAMHIDTDECNAAAAFGEVRGEIVA